MGSIFGFFAGLFSTAIQLFSSLTPQQQNGNSLLGLLTAPLYPQFLTNNPLPQGYPWGSATAQSTAVTDQTLNISRSPYLNVPYTGVVRTYDFNVTRGRIAPDGVEKDVILINGQFPGPTIEANWGDQIIVTVHNSISSPPEGIGFHWHGILQKKTPYYDGVVSVTQCPIAPGSSFVYNFQADLYGTTWYHSHYSAQYAGGLLGPMIIHGPLNALYDLDLGPVLLTDYYHKPYLEIIEGLMNTEADFSRIAPASNNNLINGKMSFDCANVIDGMKCTPNAGVSKFKFQRGKIHRLRLINAGAEGLQRFSIDGHMLTVIANDFVPVVPYTTKVVTLGIGQRTDVLVTANVGSLTDSFWMRSNISTICSLAKQPNALAAIYYDNANTNNAPTSTAWNVPDPGTCSNDDLNITLPFLAIPAITAGSYRQDLNIAFAPNASNVFLWSINGQNFRGNYNAPVLLLANQGNTSFPPEWNVYNYYANNSLIFVVNNPAGMPPHPMHMHGHNFFVLHQGPGAWDGTTIINPTNPQRRDVQMLPGGSHIVLQIQTDNPGAWPLHCHIAWHVSSGLYITILEKPDAIKQINIPSTSAQNCRDWSSWTGTSIPNQIDSGL